MDNIVLTAAWPWLFLKATNLLTFDVSSLSYSYGCQVAILLSISRFFSYKYCCNSPAAIRLFPFLVREVPLEEIDGVRKEKERLTAAWFLVSHVNLRSQSLLV